jgi:hypothetical protein
MNIFTIPPAYSLTDPQSRRSRLPAVTCMARAELANRRAIIITSFTSVLSAPKCVSTPVFWRMGTSAWNTTFPWDGQHTHLRQVQMTRRSSPLPPTADEVAGTMWGWAVQASPYLITFSAPSPSFSLDPYLPLPLPMPSQQES